MSDPDLVTQSSSDPSDSKDVPYWRRIGPTAVGMAIPITITVGVVVALPETLLTINGQTVSKAQEPALWGIAAIVGLIAFIVHVLPYLPGHFPGGVRR